MIYTHMKSKKGFAMIYSMLILASVIASLTLAASTSGVFSGQRLKIYNDSSTVRMIAMECAETVLMQVQILPSLVTSGTISIQNGSCTYTVSGTSPNKIITISASYKTLYKRITVTTTQIVPTILSTWIEGQ